MNKILLHIPHSSTKLPKQFWQNNFLLKKQQVQEFNLQITDQKVDKLFSYHFFHHIRAPYSRVFCDTQRFLDDTEVMNKYGMGAVYTHTNTGKQFLEPTNTYKQNIINNYYKKIHQKLDIKASKLLSTKHKLILVDCHSFAKNIIMSTNTSNLPDICLGFNETYCNEKLNNFVVDYFKNQNFKVAINYPYSGAMAPDVFLEKQVPNFYCFMLEINKEIYLHQNKKFKTLKKSIYKLLKQIEKLEL